VFRKNGVGIFLQAGVVKSFFEDIHRTFIFIAGYDGVFLLCLEAVKV